SLPQTPSLPLQRLLTLSNPFCRLSAKNVVSPAIRQRQSNTACPPFQKDFPMPCLKAVTPHHIVQAEEADLEAILELQRLAYQGEARLLNDFSIPPLMQTLEEMKEEFRSGIFLKAVDEKGKIVGSVRGTLRGDTLLIGKLMVHPEHQGSGLGSCLLQELEKNCPAPRLELFTSNKSLRNLCLYERNGYTRCAEKAVSPALTLIFLEKKPSHPASAQNPV
ncbi:GNAT family N-acetyltransferase, partial [Bilophila wadsworthia]|uniref:GNAT family N-acetyltransferase n=1 Tax=Bilophila wadsworthia TaxID=35833 RepID=UPI0028EB9289